MKTIKILNLERYISNFGSTLLILLLFLSSCENKKYTQKIKEQDDRIKNLELNIENRVTEAMNYMTQLSDIGFELEDVSVDLSGLSSKPQELIKKPESSEIIIGKINVLKEELDKAKTDIKNSNFLNKQQKERLLLITSSYEEKIGNLKKENEKLIIKINSLERKNRGLILGWDGEKEDNKNLRKTIDDIESAQRLERDKRYVEIWKKNDHKIKQLHSNEIKSSCSINILSEHPSNTYELKDREKALIIVDSAGFWSKTKTLKVRLKGTIVKSAKRCYLN